jgi:hypothetical protein
MERLRRPGGGSGGRKQRDDDRMWHGWYLTSTRRLLVGVACPAWSSPAHDQCGPVRRPRPN